MKKGQENNRYAGRHVIRQEFKNLEGLQSIRKATWGARGKPREGYQREDLQESRQKVRQYKVPRDKGHSGDSMLI